MVKFHLLSLGDESVFVVVIVVCLEFLGVRMGFLVVDLESVGMSLLVVLQ